MSDKVTLLVVELNELDGLKKIMPLIKKEWYDQLIVLDGGSTDGSIEWLYQNGYEYYIQHKKGVWEGYREIFTSGRIKGDIVITFSPDGNSAPQFIPLLSKAMVDRDMVIASRYLPPAVSLDDTWLTKIGNWLFTGIINLRSGYQYTDALVIYRAYRAALVKQLGFNQELTWLQRKLSNASNLYGWESSMSLRAGRYPLRIGEIAASEPKAFRERRQSTFGHGFVVLTQIIHEGWLR
jgi:glycosyltransferase involved in cell wall biosynthesis